jgi:hypothetical protein
MKAYDGYSEQYINWITNKVPDGYGAYSGFDPNDLTGIVINKVFISDKRYITNISGDYQILEIDDLIIITSLTSGITITLPYNPNIGDTYEIKDATGIVNAFNVILDGYGNSIDGSSPITITDNYFIKSFVYDGNGWSVI